MSDALSQIPPPPKPTDPALLEEIFASLAAEWEERPEEIPRVTYQIRQIHAKLLEWGWGSDLDRDEVDHATIGYSKVVASYECCQWLPFDLVPDWEMDLYCVLMDEERWEKYREVGRCTTKLFARLWRAHGKDNDE